MDSPQRKPEVGWPGFMQRVLSFTYCHKSSHDCLLQVLQSPPLVTATYPLISLLFHLISFWCLLCATLCFRCTPAIKELLVQWREGKWTSQGFVCDRIKCRVFGANFVNKVITECQRVRMERQRVGQGRRWKVWLVGENGVHSRSCAPSAQGCGGRQESA